MFGLTPLTNLATQTPPGEKVSVELLHDGKRTTIWVTVGKQDGWRRVQSFENAYGKSISVSDNGDVLQQGKGKHQVFWRWDGVHFTVASILPRLIASSCSLADANELAFRVGVNADTPDPSVQPEQLLCGDFDRFKIMLIMESEWNRNAKLDSTMWAVYRKSLDSWIKVQDLSVANDATLKATADGDLLEDNIGAYQRIWRWNGSQFIVANTRKAVIPTTCSFIAARGLNAKNSKYNFPYAFPSDAGSVLCQDFGRFGVMVFPETGGSEFIWFAVYRFTGKAWREIQELQLKLSEELKVNASGDLVESDSEVHRRIWRWNGARFVASRRLLTVPYWNKGKFEVRLIHNNGAYPGTVNCSVKSAYEGIFALNYAPVSSANWKKLEKRFPITYLACRDFTDDGQESTVFSVLRPMGQDVDYNGLHMEGNPNFSSAGSFILLNSRASDWMSLFESDDASCLIPSGEKSVLAVYDSEPSQPTSDEQRAGKDAICQSNECEFFRRYTWNGMRFVLDKSWYRSSRDGSDRCSEAIRESVTR